MVRGTSVTAREECGWGKEETKRNILVIL